MDRTQLEREGYRPEVSLWDDGFGVMKRDVAWERTVRMVSGATVVAAAVGLVFVALN